MTPSSESGSHRALSDSGVFRSGSRGERRSTPRISFLEPQVVKVEVDGQTFSAQLLDVSTKGAELRLVATPPPSFTEGSTAQISLDANGAVSTRQGRVAWVSADKAQFRFGLEFTGGSRDQPCLGLLDPRRLKVDPAVALRLPGTLALRRQVLPFGVQHGTVHVACGNPGDVSAIRSVEKILGMPVHIEPADPIVLREVLDRVYGDGSAAPIGKGRPSSVDVRNLSEMEADAVAIGDELLQAALLRQASDVHLDPEADGMIVRFRVDGELELHRKLPPALAVGVLSRFKVLGGMDIAEKRAPQDGGFKHQYGRGGERVDIRVATIPTRHGERMTVRLLALQTQSLTLERLGCCERDLKIIETALARPHGMILLTGPTGSGKSTTLYAAIRRLMASENLNILTVEDPIEYEITGVAQVEVDSADKVSFSKALRSALRHDPDVVMIGEIRDRETADIAVKAALTGHLVFSTLHTNSAASVVTRLVDMGLERYLIAATLRLAVAQRLVRHLCARCRAPRPLTGVEAAALARPDLAGQTAFDRTGCVYCGGKGFSGRLALFEIMALDESWSRMITDGAEESALVQRMRECQVPTLLDDGIAKLIAGATTPRDVIAAVTAW
jgi:type II secretory ATPase GspE/PulE/Tfp pilus assembly ATPase PilB-like protein